MKAIGYTSAGPIEADTSVVEFETATPEPGPSDLFVEVFGVSVNPVDVKVRANRQPNDGAPQIREMATRCWWSAARAVLVRS